MRACAVLLMALLVGTPALAESALPLIIHSDPPGARVWYRERAADAPWIAADGSTPVTLLLPFSKSYDVRAEASGSLFTTWTGDATSLTPGVDHPTIILQRSWLWPRILATVLVVAGLVIVALWRQLRRFRRRGLTALTLSAADVPDTAEVLAALRGSRIRGETGACYLLGDLLGKGGMGAVFAASTDPPDGEPLAVKLLLVHSGARDELLHRFDREVRICASLQHPGIVKVLDWGRFEGATPIPFMVMERLSGKTLRQLMGESRTPRSMPELMPIYVELLQAVRAAHSAGVVHRDLKPENIMITSSGRVKVMDFGIAHPAGGGHTVTQTGDALGTPAYMSPEHLDSKHTTEASDVYSLGVIFFELAAGRLPIEADNLWSLITARLVHNVPPLTTLRADLPTALSDVVARMLEADLDRRYATAYDVLKDISEIDY